MKEKGFSLVVCTYNGANRLVPTLQHLAALHKPKSCAVELILIDNASTDNTAELARKTWNELGNPFLLNIISEARAGKGYAIETGYDAARFSFIITVDDDNWLNADYLEQAALLIEEHPDVGIFQARNKAVFEQQPPAWINAVEGYLVIGSLIKTPGYFPQNVFGVWGAGMIIKQEDWNYLRKLGFTSITSKVAGKAAGEDIELSIALLLAGKKIFYSPKLQYKHYMPAGRVSWKNLRKNFETFAYTDYYFFLYSEMFKAFEKGYTPSVRKFRRHFIIHWLRLIRSQGAKNNIQFFFKKEGSVYQLLIEKYYHLFYWFTRLSKKAAQDMQGIQRWMLPLLQNNPNQFKM